MGLIHYPDEAWKRRVIAFVYHGPGAIKKIRAIAGPTNPHIAREQSPGCVRALGTVAPLIDDTGKTIGERMDNLIHASAATSEAEREIKLWFKPNDIPPLMHAYPIEVSKDHYYSKEGKLYKTYEPDSICLIAPGDVVWKSDLDTLRQLLQSPPAPSSLESVVAKYLINVQEESH
jgi:nucleoside-diphosphate kinase